MTTQRVTATGNPPDGRCYLTYTTADDGVHVMCRECPDWDCVLPDTTGRDGDGADGGLGGAPVWMAFAVALQHVRERHDGQGTV